MKSFTRILTLLWVIITFNKCLSVEIVPLPDSIVPIEYDILIDPNLDTFKFSGKETVILDVRKSTDTIVFHSLNLNITRANIDLAVVTDIKYDNDQETVTLIFSSPLTAGSRHRLNLNFTGIINEQKVGLHRTLLNSGRYGIATQLAATYARKVFPCWDEPHFKATFKVTVVAEKNQVVLSNMPVWGELVLDDGRNEVSFSKTPLMSTYLLAVVIGEYEFVRSVTSNNSLEVRVFTPVGRVDEGEYGVETAVKVLNFYGDLLNLTYPLPKIDLIGIEDFPQGGMENWGLVTFGSGDILVKQNASISAKMEIAEIICHEIAHQWFGNLVTCKSWSEIWLNEGFTTFFTESCMDHLFPESNVWYNFVASSQVPALTYDSLHTTHPIQFPLKDSSEVDQIFDGISYKKGASILKMLEDYIGKEVFKKGISLYLKRYQYNNTVNRDVWQTLNEVSGKDIAGVFDKWITQKGYPLVSVNETLVDGKVVMKISQEPFTIDGKRSEDEESLMWSIPITYVQSGQTEVKRLLLSNASTEITFVDGDQLQWIKLNPGLRGFFRVKYSPAMMKKLVSLVESKGLSPLDRLNIQDDFFALVPSGRIQGGSTAFLEMLKASVIAETLKLESDFLVWKTFTNNLVSLDLVLSNGDQNLTDKYHSWCNRLLRPFYRELGWHKGRAEQMNVTNLRKVVLSHMANFQDKDVYSVAKEIFDDFVKNKKPIDSGIKSIVLKSVALKADNETFETLFRLHQVSKETGIATALASVPDRDMLQRVLDYSISPEVGYQDTNRFVCTAAVNPRGRDVAWNFFKNNADFLRNRYKTSYFMGNMVKCVTQYFGDDERAREIEGFFKNNPFPGTERGLKQSLESIRLNAAWLQRDRQSLAFFLDRNLL